MSRILIADDDRTTRELLRGVLKAAGFEVVTAADGAAALKKLQEKKFDLLLTDIWMPRLTGLDLLSRLREEPESPRAVVMTSDDAPETLLRAVREQAYHCVAKPVDPQVLVQVVRDALTARPTSPHIEVISAVPEWIELLVPCELEAVSRITGFMAQLKSGLSQEVREQVGHAFRELLSNAIEWGGKLNPNRKVRISCLRTRRMLLYHITDPGAGFRFEALDHAALNNPADQPYAHDEARKEKGLRPGGFGILMVRSLVDELVYNEVHNEVVFVKYLKE